MLPQTVAPLAVFLWASFPAMTLVSTHKTESWVLACWAIVLQVASPVTYEASFWSAPHECWWCPGTGLMCSIKGSHLRSQLSDLL